MVNSSFTKPTRELGRLDMVVLAETSQKYVKN
jgi:hypothetical protein